MERKSIQVVAAVIISDGKVFATQRGYGEYRGRWEFPGGKIEKNESPEDALRREIREELDTDIYVKKYIDTVEFDYPEYHLSMQCFICDVISGNLVLKEHEDARWLISNEIYEVDWLPADIEIIEKIKSLLN